MSYKKTYEETNEERIIINDRKEFSKYNIITLVVSVVSIILSSAGILVATSTSRAIANSQNKITLFEKRYELYMQLNAINEYVKDTTSAWDGYIELLTIFEKRYEYIASVSQVIVFDTDRYKFFSETIDAEYMKPFDEIGFSDQAFFDFYAYGAYIQSFWYNRFNKNGVNNSHEIINNQRMLLMQYELLFNSANYENSAELESFLDEYSELVKKFTMFPKDEFPQMIDYYYSNHMYNSSLDSDILDTSAISYILSQMKKEIILK